jgi:hypothetical protein
MNYDKNDRHLDEHTQTTIAKENKQKDKRQPEKKDKNRKS